MQYLWAVRQKVKGPGRGCPGLPGPSPSRHPLGGRIFTGLDRHDDIRDDQYHCPHPQCANTNA
jgi:hypothetical protein